jgi:septal ring factor EnvC (AmiA/AmiB activator)
VRLLFSSGGLSEFLSRVSLLRRLLSHDVVLAARYREESLALSQARQRAETSAQELSEAERQLEERSRELADERGRKRTLLARVHASRSQERGALVELEKAASALEETIRSLGETSGGAADDLPGPPFLALRRRLAPPVDAPIVRGFGRVVDSEFGTETIHSGVDFGAPAGAAVHAVAAGRVRFAGWFHGYGRMVILDHGGGYFTVSGHLDQVAVENGQVVPAGAVVGTVGETGSLAGPRLYFEIRKGGDALDPREWLEPSGAG